MYPNLNRAYYNPNNDNQKFLKQIFSRPYMLGIIISLAVILAVTVYNIIITATGKNIMDYFNIFISQLPETHDYSEIYDYIDINTLHIYSIVSMISQIISAVMIAVPFVGFLMIYIKSKNSDDLSSIKPGVKTISVFLIISLIFSIICAALIIVGMIFILYSIHALQSSMPYYSEYGQLDFLLGSFVIILLTVTLTIFIIAIGIYIFWITCAIKFSKSVKNALDGQPLTTKGSVSVGVFSIIFASVMFISAAQSLLAFVPASQAGLAIILLIPSVISSIAFTALYTFIAILAFSYKKAVNAANYSIAYSGANRYTGNISSSTAYYQSTYQDPYSDTSNPPYSTQNFEKINNQDNFSQPNTQYNTQNFQQQSVFICPSCGATVSQDNKFCNICGTRIKY